jgi:hypothetical protein
MILSSQGCRNTSASGAAKIRYLTFRFWVCNCDVEKSLQHRPDPARRFRIANLFPRRNRLHMFLNNFGRAEAQEQLQTRE